MTMHHRNLGDLPIELTIGTRLARPEWTWDTLNWYTAILIAKRPAEHQFLDCPSIWRHSGMVFVDSKENVQESARVPVNLSQCAFDGDAIQCDHYRRRAGWTLRRGDV
jgi:hypothetical protein